MTDLTKYSDFVFQLTSKTSKDLTTMMNRLDTLDANYNQTTDKHGPDINVPLFLTSAMGMSSESGEFLEIAKKCLWQEKELTEEIFHKLKLELGDVFFYLMMACRSLNLNPNDVIDANIHKLESRYPGGTFSLHDNENRKIGDV